MQERDDTARTAHEQEALAELVELQGLGEDGIEFCKTGLPLPAAGCEADLDLDEGATLEALQAAQRASWRDEARLLWMVAHLADVHAVLDPPPADGDLTGKTQRRAHGREALVQPAADVPGYGEFLAAEVAAELNVGCQTAHKMIGDALMMRHRLPRLWELMLDGQVPPWYVRRVVLHTAEISHDQAGAVDERMAQLGVGLPFGRFVERLAAEVARAAPDHARRKAAQAQHDRRVRINTRGRDDGLGVFGGVAEVDDLAAFDHALTVAADCLGMLGDESSLDIRRSKAIGVLADPARALQIHADADKIADQTPSDETDPTHRDTDPAEPGSAVERARGRRRLGTFGSTRLYVHLSAADLSRLAQQTHTSETAGDTGSGAPVADQPSGLARAEGVGPLLLDQLETWLHRRDIALTPVIDLPGMQAVDRYEIPDAMREGMFLRTPTDCFPGSSATSRGHDGDHTDTFDHGDWTRPRPPAQTDLGNLAHLGRFSHRVKTHGRWRVVQPRSGTFVWTSPLGFQWIVDAAGTVALGQVNRRE